MRGSCSMLVEVSQWLNLNTLWKRPICELLQEWRKNLASLVFFIFLLINLVGVTLGRDTGDAVNRTVVWGGGGYAGYSGINGGIAGAVTLANLRDGYNLGPGNNEVVGFSIERGKRDIRRHSVSGKDKERSSHHRSTNHSVDSNNNNIIDHRKQSKGNYDRPVTKTPLMDNQDIISLSPSYKNHTNSTQPSSQCLPNITSTTQQAICTNVRTSICNMTGKRTNKDRLPFCSMFSLSDTVEDMDVVCQDPCSNSCQEYINFILEKDERAKNMSLHFEKVVLHHFDCRDPEVPRRWNCTDCENAYKNWACSMAIPFYQMGEEVPACGDYCEQVQRVCPYLLPELDSQYMGQPTFLCTVLDNPHQITADSAAEISQPICHKLCPDGGTSVCVPDVSARNSRDTNSSPNQTPSQRPIKSKHVQSHDVDHTDNQTPSSSSDSSPNITDSETHDSAKPQSDTFESSSDNKLTSLELLDNTSSSSSSIGYSTGNSLTTTASSGVASPHGYTVKHRQHFIVACLAQLFTVLFLAQYLCMADVFSIQFFLCSKNT